MSTAAAPAHSHSDSLILGPDQDAHAEVDDDGMAIVVQQDVLGLACQRRTQADGEVSWAEADTSNSRALNHRARPCT